jgi:serine-type D-Ala-D-Ala carboxypeptidase (penicillin-binding protein 5/6)
MYHMKLLKVLAFFCVHGILSAQPLNISVSAKAAILMNAENGKILFSKNIDDQYAPASVTKIATCLLALQRIENFDERVKAPLECLIQLTHKVKKERKYQDPPYRLEPDGTSYGMYTGEYMTLKDLLYGVVLSSGNDAANIIAYHLSHGDIPAYVEDMNQYVQSLGCRNTKFYNPHGLHYPKHVATARDLATLGREAIKNPVFLEIMESVTYDRPKTNKQPARTVWTGNKLLRRGKFHYPKAFGIKTGFHSIAGNTFVGAAKDEHRVLISVVLNAPTREDVFQDTIKMFDVAFAEQKLTRQLLNHQEAVFKVRVQGTSQMLEAGLQEDLCLHYFPSEEEEVSPYLLEHLLQLPIRRGDLAGELQVRTASGEVLQSAYIYALRDINVSVWLQGLKWCLSRHGLGCMLGVILLLLGTYGYYKRSKKERLLS